MSDKPGLRPDEPVGGALRAVARHILAEAREAIEDRDRLASGRKRRTGCDRDWRTIDLAILSS
jgi:hypothetical protein